MKKKILITGATDGIGLETTKKLHALGHDLLIHGRNKERLSSLKRTLTVSDSSEQRIETYRADLSDMQDVDKFADDVIDGHTHIDVLINNAGVLKTSQTKTSHGLDVRFVVNTLAPYRLARRLTPLLGADGRVINLSSAAQSTVNLEALNGNLALADMDAYAQSKLAITMWTQVLAAQAQSPVMIAVNPGSLLGTKMVKEGFGMDGKDIAIGADILCRVALDDEFKQASGKYFDNDIGQFTAPHADAGKPAKVQAVMQTIDSLMTEL
jgi:NAD(P)-dependent dehydrogenase (short-subunit alcohol dehydrogenase family)